MLHQRGQGGSQPFELGAFGIGRDLRASHQARVAAGLAQLEQSVQHRDLCAGPALARECAAYLLVGRGAHGFVQGALAALQLHALQDVGARRQFGRHIGLAAAQDEGAHALGQQLRAQGLAVLLDGLAPALGELPRVAQEAGHEEIELRPQLAQVVLQRRARQAEPVRGLQAAQGAGAAAGGVLHHLRLVEDQQVEGLRGQGGRIAPEQGIGSQHQVVPGHVGEAARPVRALQGQHAQAGRHAGGFGLPVEEQRGGQHHQRRAGEAAAFLFQQHMGQGLRRLAQAHLVGQDAAQALGAQVLQPGQAL